MKKIMFFRALIYTGGTEKAMLNLISKLKGYDIYVGYSDEASEKSLLDSFAKYAKVINVNEAPSIEFDYLVVCTTRYHLIPCVANIKRKNFILWVHYLFKADTSALKIKEECDKIDNVISVSETMNKKLKDLFPLAQDKMSVVYNILDKEEIKEKSLIPIKLNLSETLNLVTVARVCEAKGFSRMLHLAHCLKKANIDFKWFIIGDNFYADQANEIKEKFKDFKDNFEWFGFLDNPHNIVKQCDYSVLLSDEETWGLVITEAMYLKVPCIVTDFDVAYEQVTDNKNGIILSRTDLESYETRINDIVNNKEKYKAELINYDYENGKILKQWEEIFK